MKPTDRMREYADDIQDYPELKDIAVQMRKDAADIDKTIQGTILLAGMLTVFIVLMATVLYTYHNSYDKMMDSYENHLENHLK